jgi:hypothetical protein
MLVRRQQNWQTRQISPFLRFYAADPEDSQKWLSHWRPNPPPLCFSQVLILKVVKVLCFHTLLQVLILNVVSQGPMGCNPPYL